MDHWYNFGAPKHGREVSRDVQDDWRSEINRLKDRNEELERLLSETKKKLTVYEQKLVSTLLFVPCYHTVWDFDELQTHRNVAYDDIPKLLNEYKEKVKSSRMMKMLKDASLKFMWIYVTIDKNRSTILTISQNVAESLKSNFDDTSTVDAPIVSHPVETLKTQILSYYDKNNVQTSFSIPKLLKPLNEIVNETRKTLNAEDSISSILSSLTL